MIKKISVLLDDRFGDSGLFVADSLYSRPNELLYWDGKEPKLFQPDDKYKIMVGHLRIGGTRNIRPYLSWTHNIEAICIGSHIYLDEVVRCIEDTGSMVQSYDLNGSNIWRRYFKDSEEYPENQAFVIKYTINGNIEENVNWCDLDISSVCGS